jgi:hypothetical protein
MKSRITIEFEQGVSRYWPSCREYVRDWIPQLGIAHKSLAADMDLSPSHFSRKINQTDNDSARFTLDDFERLLEIAGEEGNFAPLGYLIEKFYGKEDELSALKKRIAELEASE